MAAQLPTNASLEVDISSKNMTNGTVEFEKGVLAKVVVLFLLVLPGAFWNGVVIAIALAKKTKQRKSMVLFIANMALSDSISLLLEPIYFIVSYLTDSWSWKLGQGTLGKIFCHVFRWWADGATWVSLVTLLIISIERYRTVSSIQFVPQLNRKAMISLLILPWIIAAAINLPNLLEATVARGRCVFKPYSIFQGAYFTATCFLFVFVVVAIVTINVRIIKFLKGAQARTSELPSSQQTGRVKLFRSAVRLVMSSLLLYTLCMAPIYITLLFEYFPKMLTLRQLHVKWDVYFAVHIFLFANSTLSPLIYFTLLDEFRKPLCRICFCKSKNQRECPQIEVHELCHKPAGYQPTPEKSTENIAL